MKTNWRGNLTAWIDLPTHKVMLHLPQTALDLAKSYYEEGYGQISVSVKDWRTGEIFLWHFSCHCKESHVH